MKSQMDSVAMRRGWVTPMMPDLSYPASFSIRGIWVVLPLPVGLSTIMTWSVSRLERIRSLCLYTGRSRKSIFDCTCHL